MQDIEAGRKIEIENFGGKLVELAERQGISTPLDQAVRHIIQVLESNQD